MSITYLRITIIIFKRNFGKFLGSDIKYLKFCVINGRNHFGMYTGHFFLGVHIVLRMSVLLHVTQASQLSSSICLTMMILRNEYVTQASPVRVNCKILFELLELTCCFQNPLKA
jgi:hypothetical protein